MTPIFKTKDISCLQNAYLDPISFLKSFAIHNKLDISNISIFDYADTFHILQKDPFFQHINKNDLFFIYSYIYLKDFNNKIVELRNFFPSKEYFDISKGISDIFFKIREFLSYNLTYNHICNYTFMDYIVFYSNNLMIQEIDRTELLKCASDVEKIGLQMNNYRAIIAVLCYVVLFQNKTYWIDYFHTTRQSFNFYFNIIKIKLDLRLYRK